MHASDRSVVGRAGALVIVLLLVLFFGPGRAAIADQPDNPGKSGDAPGHQADHGGKPADVGGGGGGATVTQDETVTEDNDDDGLENNVVDEGDNAHPSGKDRSVEPGGSGNQGNAQSNPDGGEVDQPGGAGGVDVFDQDGNNGCGNDDDFEDDNNGNCGGLGDDDDDDIEDDDDIDDGGDDGGDGGGGDGGGGGGGGGIDGTTDVPTVLSDVQTKPEAEILGTQLTQPAQGPQVLGVTLARTGWPLLGSVLVALGLILSGFGLRRFGRA